MAEAGPTSFLVVEELFAAGSPDFLSALRTSYDPKPFAAFAERWLRDPRPWAREQMLAYIDLPLNVPNHNSLVKRLFKGAEARRDDTLMAAWAVSFDRLVRRRRKKGSTWDYRLRRSVPYEFLVSPKDRIHRSPPSRYYPQGYTWGERLFSYHTRYYVRRRAWRYFRYMGYGRPADYLSAATSLIATYTDDDLATGDNLMDCWSLLHACFAESESISFTTHRARLKGGASVASLSPAPAFSPLWRAREGAERLLTIVESARSAFARVWAVALLRQWHADLLVGLPAERVIPLLSHPDEAVRTLAIELFENASGLESLSFDRWFLLLQNKNLTVLDAIAAAARRHVRPDSVQLFDAVMLANTEAAPVARFGLYLLQSRTIDSPPQRQALVNLADARSAAAAYDIGTWALGILGAKGVYDVEQVTRFFDSLRPEIRAAARDWLIAGDDTQRSAGWNDPTLWARLLESPFEDMRLFLVDSLQKREKLPGTDATALSVLWTGVLLNIHRGGRRKLSALRQISDAIRNDPSQADALMPILAVAIRSVRLPETRAGLSAIVSAVAARPELAEAVKRELPELELLAAPNATSV